MALRKIFILGIILAMFLVAPAAYGAMALVWDSYTDPDADNLRIETALDAAGPWSQVGSDLPTTSTSVAITTGPDETRIYYRVVAFNTDGSAASGTVSYYWTTSGGGGTGVQTPGGVGFIDCSDPNLSTADEAICTSLGL